MTERVTQAEFARRENVNRSTVNRWIKAGRIAIDQDGLIDLAHARHQRKSTESPLPHHQARKAQFDDAKATTGPAADQPGRDLPPGASSDSVSAALKLETWRLQKAKAERAALEVDQLAGALVERTEVDFVFDDLGNMVRVLFEALADRYTGTLAAARGDANEIHKILDDASRDMLTEFIEHLGRRATELSA